MTSAHGYPNVMPASGLCRYPIWVLVITKLHGPAKWTTFHLHVILDIYSRYVVGWMLAPTERATLAQLLIDDTETKHSIDPDTLTLYADLGVTKSDSRTHVPNDN